MDIEESIHMNGRWLALRRNLTRRGIVPLLILLLTLSAACSGGGKKNNAALPSLPSSSVVSATAAGTSLAATTATSQAPVASAAPDVAPLAEFRMPKWNVTGKVVVKGVDPATNVMQSPDNKDDVAYYDFTSRPGFGCQGPDKCANTVLAGHVDWYTGQVGVFWHAKDLKDGDPLELGLADGKVYKYKVVSNTVYKLEDAPVEQIIGDTPQESLTLITCDGVFNKSLQEYNSRRVVRAVRES